MWKGFNKVNSLEDGLENDSFFPFFIYSSRAAPCYAVVEITEANKVVDLLSVFSMSIYFYGNGYIARGLARMYEYAAILCHQITSPAVDMVVNHPIIRHGMSDYESECEYSLERASFSFSIDSDERN